MINDALIPYFKDVYRDLILRNVSHQTDKKKNPGIDQITLIEYCHLPGILSDRIAKLFCDMPEDQISEKSFIDNFIKIFISDFDTKMKFTF